MAFPTPPAILEARNLRVAELDQSPAEALLRIYAWTHLMRISDNRILELFRQGLIRGTVTGGQGNEGLIIPLALLADKANDVASFTHRDSGAHLIWSGDLVGHLNQYFANAHSPTKAREGNIHHGDVPNRSIPMISHLGAMLSVIAGTTDSQRRQGRPAVGFAFFGDGASSTGDVHETLNLASLLSLPVIFVIENNGYAYSTPTSEQFAPGTELWKRATAYGIESFALDCTRDVPEVVRRLGAAIDQVRSTSRPMLIEANVLRLRGHAAYDTCDYLRPGESDGFLARDPVPRFRTQVVEAAGLARVGTLEAELNEYLEACIKIAIATPRPSPEGMEAEVFAPASAPLPWKAGPDVPAQLNIAQSLNLGLRKILGERPESIILGQDIGTYGGAFKVTENLLKEFGRPRVFNTPLAESACTGYAIGLALNGHRPIEEFQFADFATEAMTQIALNAGTMFFRSGAACFLTKHHNGLVGIVVCSM
jgi:2-oxoisovalerate dehydrogenase E1 component